MNYLVRLMTSSEHTDASWEDLFSVADEERKAYCVVYVPSGRVVDDTLTFSEAKSQAEYYQDVDDQDDAEYNMDMEA